jgi:hypothetical protein
MLCHTNCRTHHRHRLASAASLGIVILVGGLLQQNTMALSTGALRGRAISLEVEPPRCSDVGASCSGSVLVILYPSLSKLESEE